MTIKFTEPKKILPEDIEELEKVVGCPINKEVYDFLNRYSGAMPESNIFDVYTNQQSNIREIYTIPEIIDSYKLIDYEIDKLDPLMIPITYDGCGNEVYINLREGSAIYFLEHETADIYKVANSIHDFLQMIIPDNFDLEPS